MEIIEIARQLGAAIQADERYAKYQEANANCDNDAALQEAIGKFNLGRMSLDNELSKDDKDEAKIQSLNDELRKTYGEVMTNPTMIAYNEAKSQLDVIVSEINSILELCLRGEDPATCDPHASGCSGSCASCGGCH